MSVHTRRMFVNRPQRGCRCVSREMPIMQRILIAAGLMLLAAGLLWPWLSRLPLGRLPGDISIVRENFSFYFPITTGLLVSFVLTVLVWLFRR